MDGGDLNEVMIFTRVIEAQGITAAAKLLGQPKSTVSRKLSDLERRLGVALLVRTTRKLHLTEAGAAYYERCARIVSELDEAERAVRDLRATPKGTLRITAPVDFALMHMGQLVTRYTRKYPEVDLVLDLSSRRVDLVAEGIDVALRAGMMTDSSLIARKLVDDTLGLIASPHYLEQHGTPKTVAELAEHACIVYGREPRTTWRLSSRQRTAEVKVKGRICSNELGFALAAAVSGGGIALVPMLASASDRQRKRVVHVLPDYGISGGGVYAVYPSVRGLTAAARSFVDMTAAWITKLANN